MCYNVTIKKQIIFIRRYKNDRTFRRHRAKRAQGKKGFTLIELIIVIAILAILGTVVGVVMGGQVADAKKKAVQSSAVEFYSASLAAITADETDDKDCFTVDASSKAITATVKDSKNILIEYLSEYIDIAELPEGELHIYMEYTTRIKLLGVLFKSGDNFGGKGSLNGSALKEATTFTAAADLPTGVSEIILYTTSTAITATKAA